LARQGRWGLVLAILVVPPLFAVSAGGNIQALMVLTLLLGIQRRWGPVAVAAAASMKFTPILLVAAYIARREWWKATLSLALAVVLLLPGLLMGITGAGVQSEAAPSLLGISTLLYAAVIIAGLLVTMLVPPRYSVLAAATTAVLALPRLFVYDTTLVAVGAVLPEGTPKPLHGKFVAPRPS
jgi:hypothetical protein